MPDIWLNINTQQHKHLNTNKLYHNSIQKQNLNQRIKKLTNFAGHLIPTINKIYG